MVEARIYPKADAKTQWFENKFARGKFTSIEKILLHTTETTGWPSYAGGSMAPTFTYHCKNRAWRQHNYLDTSARALADPDATVVKENRDNVVQIEIIAYADEKMAASVGGLPVSKLTEDNLKDLATFIVWVRKEWGGPPLVSTKFAPYPESYGANNYRLTGPQYDAFKGILGHSNVPAGDTWGNRHGDPGALNIDRIMVLAKNLETVVTKPPVTKPPAVTPPTDEVIVISDADAKKIAQQVWGYPIQNHDPKPNDNVPPATYAAKSYTVMGNFRGADLQARMTKVEADIAEILSLLRAPKP